MTLAHEPPRSRSALLLEGKALQRRALELLQKVDQDARAASERIAAAEAHLRLFVTGQGPQKLLDRAVSLDPYRAELYFVLGLEHQKAGALAQAIEMYDHAVLLAPSSARYRLHRGYALLMATRRTGSSELAEAAQEDLEAAGSPLGAIEAAIYGKSKRLREQLAKLFARVEPSAKSKAAVTRLLYQAIFAFGVGKAKNVDTSNKKTMDEIVEVARRWLGVFPGDKALGGVIAAATAKLDNAETLCERIATYAAEIPDVRILRLLLRERLAEVSEPQRRLELFEGAMTRIPPLDGIVQDYLQLVHLVAKRALAVGDVRGARAAWETCLARDPDNPATVHNLLRLAEHAGDEAQAKPLRAKLKELWAIYAEHSPRADKIFARAAADVAVEVEADLTRVRDGLRRNEKQPKAAEIEGILHRVVVAHALSRAAADPEARAALPRATLKALVTQSKPAPELFGEALEVVARMPSAEPPVAYAYLGVPKDAPDDVLERAKDERMERLSRGKDELDNLGEPSAHLQALMDRTMAETRVLFDAQRRPAYDRVTCSVELSELLRAHVSQVIELAALGQTIADEEVPPRSRLAGKLWKLRSDVVRAYFPSSENDESWFDRACARVAYGSVIRQGFEAYKAGAPEKSVDLAQPYLEPGGKLFELQALYAMSILEDTRKELMPCVELARKHAKLAIAAFHWADSIDLRKRMNRIAENTPDEIAQEGASERAMNSLAKGHTAAALRQLLAAYPGARSSGRTYQLQAESFLELRPAGRGQYAWAVARSIRANTIEWFNGTNPTSQWEYSSYRTKALAMAIKAEEWARYARGKLEHDPLPPEYIQAALQSLDELLAALQRDRNSLSGGY
jgi:tetratricopeptide (TPR) repeat protein